MSIRWMTKVWDDQTLSGPRLLMMLALADYANEEGVCWPSLKSIQAKLRMSRTRAYDLLDQLKVGGHVVKQPDGRYQLACPENGTVPKTGLSAPKSSRKRENPQTPLKVEPSIRETPLPQAAGVGVQQELPSRARNVVWDALALATAAPQTKSETSDFAKTVKELTQTGATPEQIAGFAPWWMLTFPGASLTHRCYRLHWAAFLVSLTPASSRAANYLS